MLADVNNQGDKIYIWAVVDVHAKIVKRNFRIVGTGNQITGIEFLTFFRTVHMPNGLVWHIFEVQDE